jgi:hypothetical protein
MNIVYRYFFIALRRHVILSCQLMTSFALFVAAVQTTPHMLAYLNYWLRLNQIPCPPRLPIRMQYATARC